MHRKHIFEGLAVAALALIAFFAPMPSNTALAAPPANISQTVGVCDPVWPQRCIKPAVDGSIAVTGTLTPSGTADVNLKQVNGTTVTVGAGAGAAGTQRVTTSTDSTIGTVTNPVGVKGADGSTIASSTNPVPVDNRQINGVAMSTGTGVSGTGTQRVAVSTDSVIGVAPTVINFTDKSGTITLGGTSQTMAAVNASRRRILIENYCSATSQGIATAESLFVNWTTAAGTAAGSMELSPCGSYDSSLSTVSGEQINVYAATTGHKFMAKEQ